MARSSPLRTWAAAELALAAGVAASLFGWDRFPDVVEWTLVVSSQWGFVARELVRFVFVLALLLPATLSMGVALPALAASVGAERRADAAWVGRVFAANTVGAILGALVTGFVLLGRVPSHGILRAVALCALVLAVASARRTGRVSRRFAFAAVLATAAALAHTGWNMSRLTAGSHYYWAAWMPVRQTFVAEDAQSGFVSVDQPVAAGTKVLKTNGKYEATDEAVEFQDAFALLGAMYAPAFGRAAVLGLGAGRTMATLHALSFRELEVMEFSPAIIRAARHEFGRFVDAPLADTGRVRLVCDDGRNHLQLSQGGYDLIVVGATGAAFAGVGSLYSREFFEIVRDRLTPEGVLVLWLQLHHVPWDSARSAIYTLRSAFPHVHVYGDRFRVHAYLIASARPLRVRRSSLAAADHVPHVRDLLRLSGNSRTLDLASLAILTREADLQAYFTAGAPFEGPPVVYTDDRPAFEFETPRGLATHRYDFSDLRRYASGTLPALDFELDATETAALVAQRPTPVPERR